MNFNAYRFGSKSTNKTNPVNNVDSIYEIIPFMSSTESCRSQLFDERKFNNIMRQNIRNMRNTSQYEAFLNKINKSSNLSKGDGRSSPVIVEEVKKVSPAKFKEKDSGIIFQYHFEIENQRGDDHHAGRDDKHEGTKTKESFATTHTHGANGDYSYLTPNEKKQQKNHEEFHDDAKQTLPETTDKSPGRSRDNLSPPAAKNPRSNERLEHSLRITPHPYSPSNPKIQVSQEATDPSPHITPSTFSPQLEKKMSILSKKKQSNEPEFLRKNISYFKSQGENEPLEVLHRQLVKRGRIKVARPTPYRNAHSCSSRTPSSMLKDVIKITLSPYNTRKLYFDQYAEYLYKPL